MRLPTAAPASDASSPAAPSRLLCTPLPCVPQPARLFFLPGQVSPTHCVQQNSFLKPQLRFSVLQGHITKCSLKPPNYLPIAFFFFFFLLRLWTCDQFLDQDGTQAFALGA